MSDPAIKRRGLMLVLSSPSGAGKTSIARALLSRDGNLTMSVSVTTRPIRNGEKDSVDYFFIDEAAFEAMAAGDELLEHAQVFGHRYGTPRAAVDAALDAGRDVLFDIDWQGTQQLTDSARADLVTVFVLPPSMDELERRLRARKRDPDDVIAGRMAKATEEMSHWREYDFVVVNDDLDDSVAEVTAILSAERLRRERQTGLAEFVNSMRRST